MGGNVKPWPEFVEGLLGGGLAGKASIFFIFLISFVLQRPVIRILLVATGIGKSSLVLTKCTGLLQ
jgi:hypothetical protein